MRISLDHPDSLYGMPTCLDAQDNVLPPPDASRAARAILGLSQWQLAALCGVGYWTVCQWEQGRRPVPATALLVMKRELERKDK